MSTREQPDDPRIPDADLIRDFLLANPDFVREDAELFSVIVETNRTDGAIDLASAARDRLRDENRQLKALNASIVETARANLATQAQTHMAVLALMEVDSLAGLDKKISNRLTGALGVDVCRVLIEGHAPLKSAESILGAAEGFVSGVLGDHVELLGPVSPANALALYGQQGARVSSQAIIRLDFGGRDGLMALAARDAHLFQAGQGTELLNFLARAVERMVVKWLHQS